MKKRPSIHLLIVWSFALAWAVVISTISYFRWAAFEYRSFDLAFYVQGLWQFLHGRFEISLLSVPLMGNHAEPIVFLIAPVFAVFQHPMTFVVVQSLALACMAPVGYCYCRDLGFSVLASILLGATTLLAPATCFVGLHEFHPEALAAPLLLLMCIAYARRRWGAFCCWFLLALGCKENIALLLVAFCVVHGWRDRRHGLKTTLAWNIAPLVLALAWFFTYSKVVSPALNHGNVEYMALYSHLRTPSGAWSAIWNALTHGNLLWATLLPFGFLPLLKPRWLLVAAPILLQHLLSWRSSEWQVYFHYAAPLIPIFWVASVEGIRFIVRLTNPIALAVCSACLLGQVFIGPAAQMVATAAHYARASEAVRWKRGIIAGISPSASVTAPLPYLSHLAMRSQLVSLHHVLKGLKTLSREEYIQPAPTEVVFIDYDDTTTFDSGSGYYHPQMRSVDGRTFPSSDDLLHRFLARATWHVEMRNSVALFVQRPRDDSNPVDPSGAAGLTSIRLTGTALSPMQPVELVMAWEVEKERRVFPWLLFELTDGTTNRYITKGLCAPEVATGTVTERWQIRAPSDLRPGRFQARAVFVDNSRRAWADSPAKRDEAVLFVRPLGELTFSR